MMVGWRNNVVPRFTGAWEAAGARGGVRDSKEVVEWIDFTLVEGLVRGVGGKLWWRSGKLDGYTSAGDNGGRSCLRSGCGGNKIPGTGDDAGVVAGGLSGDGGGDELDGGRHFVDSK